MTNCLHPIGIGYRADGTSYLMPCKLWRCPVCSRILKNKLMTQVNLYFRNEPNTYFYTFTEQADSGRDIMKDLIKFRNTLYRGLKERDPTDGRKWIVRWKPVPRIKAFWVKEFTQRGIRHIHMMSNYKMSNEELSQRWRHATNGVSWHAKITDDENFRIKSPAAYMMKYMAKQLTADKELLMTGEHQFAKHERRTGFWKPAGVEKMPGVEWDDAPAADEEIEIGFGHKWNPASLYWPEWYSTYAQAWGQPFERYMQYTTVDTYGKMTRTGGIDEYDFEPIRKEVQRDDERTALREAMKKYNELQEKKRLDKIRKYIEI